MEVEGRGSRERRKHGKRKVIGREKRNGRRGKEKMGSGREVVVVGIEE